MKRLARAVGGACLAGAIGLAVVGRADAAEIHVMISGGFSTAYDELVPLYEKASGDKVVTERGPSMGATPQAIPNRLMRGEPCDVVILVDAGLDDLVARRLAVEGSRTDLANATIWMAVKAGTVRPDISSVAAFVRTLEDARSIAYSDSASGVYLEKTLLPRLDPDGSLRAKSRMIPAEPVGQVVARGDAALGFQQKSELQPVAGITIVGPIPDALQKSTTFVAGHRDAGPRAAGRAQPRALPRLARRAARDHQERHGAGQRDDDEGTACERDRPPAGRNRHDARAGSVGTLSAARRPVQGIR